MFKQASLLIVVLICVQCFCGAANKYDSLFDDSAAAAEGSSGGDEQQAMVERQEATQFLKRLFHPFSTKNEEIKRETREVYEEKCESIIPGQRFIFNNKLLFYECNIFKIFYFSRFCPDLKTWKLFKDYENGK